MQTLTVTGTTLFHFVLAASSSDPRVAASLTMTINDSAGHTVLSLATSVGQPAVSTDLYLNAGIYSFLFVAHTQNSVPLTSLCYDLGVDLLSDQQGPYMSSTTNNSSGGYTGPGGGAGGGYTYSGSSTTSTSTSSGGYTY